MNAEPSQADTTSRASTSRPDDDAEGGPALSRQRRRLRLCLIDLEEAVAQPLPGRVERWKAEVRQATVALSEAWAAHIEFTEAEDGFFRDLMVTAPRLANAVGALEAEHAAISDSINEFLASLDRPVADVATWGVTERAAATEIMGALTRHRQRGADLTYEAMNVDIGQSG
jgi:hypothetical protein